MVALPSKRDIFIKFRPDDSQRVELSVGRDDAAIMLKKSPLLLAALCALLLTGCLEFERQTLTYQYDAKTDTLRIFQAYQGIFGVDKPDALSGQELEQLQSVLSTPRTFFFANWIAEYNRDLVREKLAESKTPEANESATAAAARARLGMLLQMLLDNVRVENGGFHLDDKGKLCGVQRVTVIRVSKLIAAGNESIRDALKADQGNLTAEERALYAKSAAGPADYIQIEGNQLRVRFPITRPDFEKNFGPKAEANNLLDEFRRSGGTLAFADNEMKWSIGKPADKTTRITLPVSDKPYLPNLLAAVKKQSIAVREKFDPEAAAKEFLGGATKNEKPPK